MLCVSSYREIAFVRVRVTTGTVPNQDWINGSDETWSGDEVGRVSPHMMETLGLETLH